MKNKKQKIKLPKVPTKKTMQKYRRHLKIEAKKFKITDEDLSNLYDMFYMTNWQDYKDIKLNKMDKWFNKFFKKIEKIVIPELY